MSGMKPSTIKLVLRKKLKNWLNTIADEHVRELASRDCIVTGGAITSMLLGEDINDYDVYFATREATLAVAQYYVGVYNKTNGLLHTAASKSCNPQVREEVRQNCKGEDENRILIYMQSAGVTGETQTEYQYFESKPESDADDFAESLKSVGDQEPLLNQFQQDPIGTAEEMHADLHTKVPKVDEEGKNLKQIQRYRPVFMSENAVTLTDKMQLVIRFYGKPEQIHTNYDYVHCMCWYRLDGDELSLPQEALTAILSKTLNYKGSLYPLASIFRIRKFIERGWRITAGQLLKIMFQISRLNLSDQKVMREQLLGVDQAYMNELLGVLAQTDGKIDATYLAKVIDNVFE